ncbi:MAG: hypothetical protein IJG33_17360 [Selenomonadaceae bacterium]|nr:hypothetical protein [Selenomonadaceae bacterium]
MKQKLKSTSKIISLFSDATWTGNTIVDAYDEDNKLNFKSNLYGRAQDWSDYGYYTMWYQVVLEEEVKHFFMPGWFKPMTARVQSVAKITHYKQGPNLLEQTDALAKSQTYLSWDHIKSKKGDNSDNADNRSVLSTGNKYREGDKHRFELLRLNGKGGKYGNNDAVRKANPYNSIGPMDQTGYDNLFVDWQTDMSKMEAKDLDLGIDNAKSDTGKGWTHFFTEDGTVKTLTGDENLQRRIHGTINFESVDDNDDKFPYPVRDANYLWNNEAAYNDMVNKQKAANKDVFKDLSKEEIIAQIARDPPDPLYVRIESEPVHDGNGYYKDPETGIVKGSPGNNASSVRQIIINLNVANTTKYTSGANTRATTATAPYFSTTLVPKR